MSRRKFSLDRRARRFCLEIQPTSLSECLSICARGFASELSSIPVAFIVRWGPRQSSVETWQARRILKWQPWFYRRLVAYRYFWLSEEA